MYSFRNFNVYRDTVNRIGYCRHCPRFLNPVFEYCHSKNVQLIKMVIFFLE